jgi:hypothetical protein
MEKTIFMGLMIGAIVIAMVASSTIPAAYAQLSKDNGASGFAGPTGGWMPDGRPANGPPVDPAAENPGQSGLKAEIIGPDLKCVVGPPPC